MTTLAEVFVMVRPDMKQFAPDLRKSISKVDATSSSRKAGEQAGDGFSEGFSRGTKKLVGIAAAALVSSKVKEGFKESISAASDLNETQSKVGVIFGKSAKDIQAFAATADTALGQSAQSALDANATFGIFGKSAGLKGKSLTDFTTKFTTLASDMASFNNTSPEQAIEAIGAALRGESEPIRSYGVLLDDATLKAEAMRLGLVKATKDTDKIQAAQIRASLAQKKYNEAVKEHGKNSSEAKGAQASLITAQSALNKATEGSLPPLTQQQKVLAAQSAIMKQTTAAQGDFARTSGGLANQQRIAAAQADKLKVAIGNALLPVVLSGATALNQKLLPPLIDLAEKHGPKLGAMLQDVALKAGPFVTGFLEKTGPLFTSLSNGSNEASPALTSLADSGAKLGPVIAELVQKIPSLTDTLNVGAAAIGFLADHTDLLAKAMPFLVAGIVAYKAAQLAANVVQVLAVPTKVAEVVVNRQLVKSNKELIVSRAALTVTQATGTVATGASTTATAANTTATNAGILATIRQRVAAIASSVAQKAVAVATAAWTGAQWLLNAALTANPIGLIVVGIALLVAGLILAYKKSETFRKIVDGAFRAVQAAAAFAFNWVKDNWKLILGIVTGPIGAAVLVIATHWDSIKSAAQVALKFVVDKFLGFVQTMLDGAAKAFGWVPGLGDKLKGAAKSFGEFRDDVNRKLSGITDQTISIKPVFDKETMSLASAGRRAAGGPGGPVRGPGTTTSDEAGLYALSTKEWVIKAKSSQKYGDYAMASVNAGTATIIPNGGLATGGRPGLTVRPDIPAAAAQAAFASGIASGAKAIGQSFSAALARQLGVNPGLGGALTFARSQVGKPYVWGGVGPGGYDCSGFMSAITNYIRGRNPYRRVGATGNFPWGGFAPGMGSFAIGSRKGNPGHMAGTLNGVNVESRGGRGVVVGAAARGARDALFGGNIYHLAGFAAGGKVGDAAFDLLDPRGKKFMGRDFLASLGIGPKLFDRGGKWRHGELGLNLSGKTETVRTAEQEAALGRPIQVRVFIGDRELTDMVRVEIDDNDRRKADQFLSGPVY